MRDELKVMDVDIHLIEPLHVWRDYIDPAFRDRVPVPSAEESAAWMTLEGRPIPAHADDPGRRRALDRRYADPAALARIRERGEEDFLQLTRYTTPEGMLAAMDREGVDLAVAFRTFAAHLIAFDDQPPHFSAALCRAFNRWLDDFCATDRTRLKVGAQVPLQDPAIAVEEAAFAIEQSNATVLVLPSHPVKNRPLYDPELDPLWALAQEAGVPVAFHGIHASYTEGMLASRFPDNQPLGQAVGQPVELMIALGAVITGGVAARFPDLRFAFVEGNCGWLPWWLWALDERFERWSDPEDFGQSELPSELFMRQCFVATEPDERYLRSVVDQIGDDNLIISTDWPHDDSSYPHAIDQFLTLDLTADTQRKILWDNGARLYGLG